MNEESIPAAEVEALGEGPATAGAGLSSPPIPAYLEETYWWAYLHPRSVWFFEREWLVNLILWGQMRRLTDAVLTELGQSLQGPLLQVACVYGDFSRRLAKQASCSGVPMHVADIAPIQLRNARSKLTGVDHVLFHHQDSADLRFTNGMFSTSVVFFLLHEQPAEVRRRTIAEAIRVTRPGGKVIFVDYHRPSRFNPLRYLMQPVLRWLEPFAMDLWEAPLESMLPPGVEPLGVTKTLYGGGLYQLVAVQL